MNTSQPQQSSAYSVTVVAISAIVIGMVTAIAATGFVAAIQWLNDNLFVSPLSRATLYDAFFMSPVVIVLVTTLGGLVTGLLVSYISGLKRPLGPPDTIQAVQLNQPMPDTKSGLVSTLAAVISLGCGASVGQYGPLVYMGALVGDLLRKLQLGFESYRSIFIACGVAAAISSAFSAPIAGLVFAHEVILRHYSMRLLRQPQFQQQPDIFFPTRFSR
ncbi:hypothetical protein CS022_10845 [Veronia nyctiphanis]|uniref:Chloride channel protein n=1 Tax=Veronia nyctiphanis TaxID=1278244 RepID=A0A4Q0YQD1_9GAMM|nr:hypothetical protein CS022_10845 [Veronia nyctiphanis]